MLLEKIVSGVKEFLAPQEPNVITELDLTKCLGRRIEVEDASGHILQLMVGEVASIVDGTLVDHVTIGSSPTMHSYAVVQRLLHVGQPMVYSDTIGAYHSSLAVRTASLKRITVHY